VGALAATLYDYVLALHIMSVVVAFGFVFALPIVYYVAVPNDPRSLPLLHRVEYTVERLLINPALLVLLLAGAYLASDGNHWSEFFVQWGLGVVIVIGAIVGSVMIPTAKRAEQTAARDLAAADGGQADPSKEYLALTRRLNLVGSLLGVLVLITIVIMTVKP